MVEKRCPQCEGVFRVKPGRAATSTYCSKGCMGEGYRARLVNAVDPQAEGRERGLRASKLSDPLITPPVEPPPQDPQDVDALREHHRATERALHEWVKANGPGGWIDDLRKRATPPAPQDVDA